MVDFTRSWEDNFPSWDDEISWGEDDFSTDARRVGRIFDDALKEANSERTRALHATVFAVPFNENSPSVQADCLMQNIMKCRQLATEYDLFELEKCLSETLQALNGDTPAHLECQRTRYAIIHNLTAVDVASWNGEKLRKEYANYASMIRSMFEGRYDGLRCRREFIQLIGPMGRFDFQFIIQTTQERLLKKMSSGRNNNTSALEQDFEAGDPLSALRNEENGYKSALTKANDCVSAEEADALAKNAFQNKKLWTAELWWERAIELEKTNAKYFSNLATLHIKIGRYLRSIEIGYRGLATRYLEKAVESAKKGIAADPSWERSYQRGAEAYFALGSHERAIDALKLLKPAFCKDSSLLPSDKLKALHFKAKANAKAWLSLRVIPGRTTVSEIIKISLENLRKVIIQSFPLCYRTDKILPPSEEIAVAGDDIVDALNVTLGALQLMYTRRLEWEVQYRQSNVLKIDFQFELREAAKVVPLQTLVHSEKLRKMAFAEDTVFSLWGMDRCDRLNVEMLPLASKDPCEHDGEDSEKLDEICHRTTDYPGVVHNMSFCKEMANGKQATSFDCDMANHHLCAFTMTLLDRIVLSDHYPDLSLNATKRVIELTLSPNALRMGGEFIGKVIKAVSGFEAFNTEEKDTSKFFRFIELEGGLGTIAREVYTGGDMTGIYQKLLCKLTPQHLGFLSEKDVICLLYEYALCSLDRHHRCFQHEQISEHVKVIISNILMSDVSFENTIVPCLAKSAFGQYLMRKLAKLCGGKPDPRTVESMDAAMEWVTGLTNVVPEAVDKWGKMSKKMKSYHRWNSMSLTKQARLASMRPLSRVEKFGKVLENGGKKEKDIFAVSELPECPVCECIVGLKVCTCNLVYYCSKECQLKHWKEHKAIHKKAMKCSTVS